jgi:two-component system KDP operon response regulator KdpE
MAGPDSASRSRSPSQPRADATILVVDDEPALLRVLTAGLQARGYRTRTATTGAQALEAITIAEPDVTLLDLGLPDLDGIEVCRRLRQASRNPIIVLTADGAEDRKIQALDEGADDYVTKPFSLPELLARIRVALRHRHTLARGGAEIGGATRVGSLVIDADAHVARLGDEELRLTRKEFALLDLLAVNAGRVLTHRAILDQVWGPEQTHDTLRTHVALLRRKLGDGQDTPRIVTEPGVGYRLLQHDASLVPEADPQLA